MIDQSISWDRERLRLPLYTLVSGLVGGYVLALAMIALATVLPSIIVVPPIVLVISLVPGALFLLVLSNRRTLDATFVVYAFGLSLVLLMLLGLLLNLTLPPLGLDRPISVGPLVVSITVLIGALVLGVRLRHPNDERELIAPTVFTPVPIAFALLVALSVLGSVLITRLGFNWLLVAVLVVIAFVPLAVLLFVQNRWHSFGIWSIAIAVLYHDALSAGKTFPGNPVVVRIARAGRWEPGNVEGFSGQQTNPLSTELLQHGTIFPMFAHLNNIDIMTQMVLVNPFFVAFIPVAIFLAFRQYVPSRLAFLGASMFVFAHPFFIQYPTAGRVATPVLFLSLFALVVTDTNHSNAIRAFLAQLFLGGVVFTHYGTSYFVMIALVGAIGLIIALRSYDYLLERTQTSGWLPVGTSGPIRQPGGVLSLSLVGFFVVFTLSWFLLTNDGRGFGLFPRHSMGAIDQLISGDAAPGAGRTGARLERDYGSITFDVLRWMYAAVGLMIAIGVVVTGIHRLVRPDRYFISDDYFAMAIALLLIFGTTVVVRTWGGGRPMMITFTFSLIFAVIGMMWLASTIEPKLGQYFTRHSLPLPTRNRVLTVFAIMVALLFVLNSGVLVALGAVGDAPSTHPASDGSTSIEYNLATHAWLIDHNNESNVYGDYRAHGHTDWIAPAIAARTADVTNYGSERPRNNIEPLMEPGVGSGYLLLLSHNVERGELDRYHEYQPIDTIRPEYRQNRVYTTGHTHIYRIDTSGLD